jgi:cytochrome c oxidase subunit 2
VTVTASGPRGPRRGRGGVVGKGVIATLGLLLLSGCSLADGPSFGIPKPVTKQTVDVYKLWSGSWIAAFVIGGMVWALILWSCWRYRRRTDELPRQVRMNLPIEILYTVLPVVVIATLFYYTAIIEDREDQLTARPAVVVNVVAYQWNWQFNYVNEGLSVSGTPGVLPELVLPIDRSVRFVLNSTDVQHSFWVPAFLFKRDVVPGRNNQFEITITKPGVYRGRCAEFCGVDHDRMLFTVRALPQAEYDKFISDQEAARGAVAAAPSPSPSTSTTGSAS